jgi:predicted transcriptional regulator
MTPAEARARRLAAGQRLGDVAHLADCAQATVRSYELGATVRPNIEERLQRVYAQMTSTPSSSPTTRSAETRVGTRTDTRLRALEKRCTKLETIVANLERAQLLRDIEEGD